jgi:hypothetical protein
LKKLGLPRAWLGLVPLLLVSIYIRNLWQPTATLESSQASYPLQTAFANLPLHNEIVQSYLQANLLVYFLLGIFILVTFYHSFLYLSVKTPVYAVFSAECVSYFETVLKKV